MTNNDCNVYLAIIAASKQCAPTKLSFHHILGHQDTKSTRPLTCQEVLNIKCNKQAKTYISNNNILSTSIKTPAIPEAQPHLRSMGRIICCKVHTALQHAISFPEYGTYLKKKFHWSQTDLNSINWMVLSWALDSFTPNDQCCLILFINNKLPLQASKAHPHNGSSLCPSCQ